MIEPLTPYRPGLAAIAAVLALSSTSGIAQVALPDVSAPAPAAPVQAAPVEAAPVQTVQAVPPSAPRLPDIGATEAPAKPARSVPVQRAAAPQATMRPSAPVAAIPVARAEAPAPSRESARPSAPPASVASGLRREAADIRSDINAIRDDSRSAQTPAISAPPASSGSTNDLAGWVLIGGGLLLVAGGATFAMARRPKRRDEGSVAPEPMVATAMPAPVATTPVVVAPMPVAPERQTYAVRPPVDALLDDRQAALEAMVAEAPSEANPFHSRRNRLRRADFLLRTGQASAGTPDMEPQRMATEIRDRWSAMSFGGQRATRLNWKPSMTR